MPSEPRRNAPCSCGSGRKYKQCCLRKQQEADRARASRAGTVGRALDWIEERHPEAASTALDEAFFGGLSESEREGLGELGAERFEMVHINSREWLIADGELDVGNGPATTTSLVLGPGGPLLSVEGRAYLEEFRRQPLRLYHVVESVPGEGLTLQDARDAEAAPLFVVERAGSRSLSAHDVIAARIIPGEPAELSGAIYGFSGFELQAHQALDELERTGEADAESCALALIAIWLSRLVTPPPKIVDAGTRAPATFVTDHYRVLDHPALDRALADCPDVDRAAGGGWVRLEEPEAMMSRSLVAINPGKRRDRIELFCRSLQLANENRPWFEGVTGTAVQFVTREIVDPLATLQDLPEPGPEPEIDVPAELREDLHRHIYRNWADEPVPTLGNVTPREAVKTDRGRRDVSRLLRSYEAQEARASRRSDEGPMDYGFLWESVGLERTPGQ